MRRSVKRTQKRPPIRECPEHPGYLGNIPPKTDCATCWSIHERKAKPLPQHLTPERRK